MANETNFSATVEFLGNGAAIVSLFDSRGEWSGSGRIEIRSLSVSALYENAYVLASRSAAAKGGHLDRFSEVRA